MADLEHASLTGSQLHEPKGVAAAAANRVYVSNGAASGSWSLVPNAALATEAKAFQGSFFHVQDQKGNNQAGGDFVAGAWRTRTLNVVLVNEIPGASLSSNQITLPAGSYFIMASAPGNDVEKHKAKLRNVTDSTDTRLGSNAGCPNLGASDCTTMSYITGRFTIGSTKVFEIQHRCLATKSVDGFGDVTNFGVAEVYTDVMIWKVG